MGRVIGQRLARRLGLARTGVEGDRDIAGIDLAFAANSDQSFKQLTLHFQTY